MLTSSLLCVTTGVIKIFLFIRAIEMKGSAVMNKRWTEHFKSDLPRFYDATRKFYAKKLKPAEYKGISGGFG